jgi:flavin-dependent dehydrogenase
VTVGATLDVLVLGGGPAGAATGIALARAGASVAVLSRYEGRDRPRLGETVPPGIVGPLARLGVWDAFRADRHVPAPGTVVRWGADEPFENDYILNAHGDGWHLDRSRFDATLLRRAAEAGAQLCQLASGDRVEPDGPGWCARLRERWLRAPFLVDATGRAGCVGRRHGGRRERTDRLVGLVRFGAAADPDPRTFLESSAGGWWYAAVLPGARAVTAFFTDADLLPAGPAQRERLWARELSETRLAAGVMAAPPSAPLHLAVANTGILSQCAGPNWLAVGDAARTLDPLSGQGLEAAMTSAIRAADAVLDGRRAAALETFSRQTLEAHRRHLSGRLTHYGREQRWPARPFWQRRHTAA